MADDNNTYTPSGELKNLLDDRAQQAREAASPAQPGVQLPARPFGPAPDALPDGTPVQPFDAMPQPVTSFKRSEIAQLIKDGRYAEHRDAILKAQSLGLIEDDMTPENMWPNRQQSAQEKATFNRIYLSVLIRNASTEASTLFNAYQKAKDELEQAKSPAYDDHERVAREGRMFDAEKAWQAAEDKVKELKASQGKK